MSARSRTALALVISATLIVPIAQGQPSPTVTTLHCRRDCTGVYGQVAAEWLYALDGMLWTHSRIPRNPEQTDLADHELPS